MYFVALGMILKEAEMSSITEESLMQERDFEDAQDEWEERNEKCEECGNVPGMEYIYGCDACGGAICADCMTFAGSGGLCPPCWKFNHPKEPPIHMYRDWDNTMCMKYRRRVPMLTKHAHEVTCPACLKQMERADD
jgi:hypothetical protein